jgi:hypothetical protein
MAADFLGVVSELFGKIASFFDVFDLSFFVSGALCLGAISYWFNLSGFQSPFLLDNWMRFFELIIICYVFGLITFTSGRWLRKGFVGRKFRCASRFVQEKAFTKKEKGRNGNSKKHNNSREYFRTLLKNHGLNETEFIKAYGKCLEDPNAADPAADNIADCLYQRMWVEIRQSSELAPSLNLLNRWWVMAATYDGIAMSLIFYAIIIIIWWNGFGLSDSNMVMIKSHPHYAFVAILILSMLSIASFREAGRLENNQREEIVATMAHFCSSQKDKQGDLENASSCDRNM